ncbi:hypothetical protein [Nonomuraea sp. SYSU D8015]|uniref:hypothetical protein n=1 Tax=Nonomuraea sp. SYSU D8015 TaxID=2593644 RepID=UPI0016603CE5|nr:hypothetical protein [Nonomuraea sp. SYSU D8015]
MPHGDDLDERFNELVAQIEDEERRRMRASAVKGAKEARRTARRRRQDRLSPSERLSAYEHAPRRKVGRAWIAMATITAVIAAAGLVLTFRPDLLAPSDFSRRYTGYSPADGSIPEDTMPVIEETPPQEADVTRDPFAGSPAESWAEGAAGFTMPEPRALGGLSKKDVLKGLERTRKLLVAAYLDKKTLLGRDPDAFAQLLDREQRGWFRDELNDAKHPTRHFVNSFAPGTAELITDVIKVKGRVTLGTFEEDGLRGVEVKLNHVVVYAVHRPGRPDTAVRVVTQPSGSVRLWHDSGRLVVWVQGWVASATPAHCGIDDGYIHPFYEDSPLDGVTPTGVPADPYVLEEPDGGHGCSASQDT